MKRVNAKQPRLLVGLVERHLVPGRENSKERRQMVDGIFLPNAIMGAVAEG